jgi:hypothetical protein
LASKRNAACAALAALAFALPASATVLYSTNFASPTFTTGALAGQGGWGVYDFSNGSAEVQNTVTDGGEPAVDIDSAAAYYLYGPITPTGVITISADIDYASSNAAPMEFGAISSVSPLTSANYTYDLAAGVSLDFSSIKALPEENPNSL